MIATRINVAIDGPVGSGKSSLGQALAQKLNYQFLDTGLFYRYFAKTCVENGLVHQQKEKVVVFCSHQKEKLARNPVLFLRQLEEWRNILIQPEVSDLASQFSQIQELRKIIYQLVRILAKNKGFVVVGRDITFAVLPEAEVKIFLAARTERRIKRRHQQLRKEGRTLSLEEVKKDLIERDKRDNRNISQAEKVGLKIDTSDLSFGESINKLYKLCLEEINKFCNL